LFILEKAVYPESAGTAAYISGGSSWISMFLNTVLSSGVFHLTGSGNYWMRHLIRYDAAIMNVSRPSLHMELKVLEIKGFIRAVGHTIEILDPGALQDILGD